MQGRIHSVQTLGTLDGPGIRFVVFTQGCRLRCGCCHNPDTWDMTAGRTVDAVALAQQAQRYREYFGKDGGVTLSGGEPLLQPAFAAAFFEECHRRALHTCLDTSGAVAGEEIERLLDATDRVLLDIKYASDDNYRRYVGCSLAAPLRFLELLDQRHIPTTLRQVVIPTLNDTEESMAFLCSLKERFDCVDGIELLPFKKICTVKYDDMGLPFPFAHIDTPSSETMDKLRKALSDN